MKLIQDNPASISFSLAPPAIQQNQCISVRYITHAQKPGAQQAPFLSKCNFRDKCYPKFNINPRKQIADKTIYSSRQRQSLSEGSDPFSSNSKAGEIEQKLISIIKQHTKNVYLGSPSNNNSDNDDYKSVPETERLILKGVRLLEYKNETKNPARSTKLIGTWSLLYTNSLPVIKNKGLTGLAKALPFMKLESVTQTFSDDGAAKAMEVIKLGYLTFENSLIGKYSAVTGSLIEQTYEEAILGKTKLKSTSKAVLETSYLGSTLRIGRSKSNAIFIFERAVADNKE